MKKHINTLLIHAGQPPDPLTGAVVPPISLSTTFAWPTPSMLPGTNLPSSLGIGFDYSRSGNPSRGALEECLASISGAKYAVCYASGLAAVAATVHLLKQGDHMITGDDVYGGTNRFFKKIVMETYGIDVSFVDLTDLNNLKATLRENTKLIWLESPTNPMLKITDIRGVVEIARENNIKVALDNTFLSPLNQRPLELGCDIEMNSVTKYINGHSDVIMGVVSTNDEEIYERLVLIQKGVGAVPSPFDCYLTMRGLKTLHVRMKAHEENAHVVAQMLENHVNVKKVLYPGLTSHPQHEIAKKQQSGFGGMITFFLADSISNGTARENAERFISKLKLFTFAVSLGAVESLVELPGTMTHGNVDTIDSSAIRLSIGIEHSDDLVTDLKNALETM